MSNQKLEIETLEPLIVLSGSVFCGMGAGEPEYHEAEHEPEHVADLNGKLDKPEHNLFDYRKRSDHGKDHADSTVKHYHRAKEHDERDCKHEEAKAYCQDHYVAKKHDPFFKCDNKQDEPKQSFESKVTSQFCSPNKFVDEELGLECKPKVGGEKSGCEPVVKPCDHSFDYGLMHKNDPSMRNSDTSGFAKGKVTSADFLDHLKCKKDGDKLEEHDAYAKYEPEKSAKHDKHQEAYGSDYDHGHKHNEHCAVEYAAKQLEHKLHPERDYYSDESEEGKQDKHANQPKYVSQKNPDYLDSHQEPDFGDDEDQDFVAEDKGFREINGEDNNLKYSEFGAVGVQFLRLAPNDPTRLDDEHLPGPREISNLVNAQAHSMSNARGMSDYAWVWGQFLDHDITLTDGKSGETADIAVPKGDPFFDPFGTGESKIAFGRSEFHLDEHGQRQHSNHITAYIDASQVYGSEDELASRLRTHQAGQLELSEGDMLPIKASGTDPNRFEFEAGDVRSNENVALTAMHTLFAREHNRVAAWIAEKDYANTDLHDTDVDEAIYQRARAIVGAQMQHITYNEFLPAVLGQNAMSEYTGYDEEVNPGISTEFSTAAFRFGHTMLSSELLRLDEHGEVIEDGNLALRDAFFRPDKLVETGLDPVLRGLAEQHAQEVDTHLIDDVRNFLFGPPGAGGFDLASLNIQRGRDHELPSYNDVREAYGLEAACDFEDISDDPHVVEKLRHAYGEVSRVDLWVGGLAEKHVEGGSLGETFSKIVADQFERLRNGDRYWYETSLSEEDLAYVKNTTLSKVIANNSGAKLQGNVFFIRPQVSYYV